MELLFALLLSASAIHFGLCHEYHVSHYRHSHNPRVWAPQSLFEELDHIHHMEDAVGHRDIDQMAEDELRFLYFKMHDSDDNDKLDGCELVKSVLHWDAEEQRTMAPDSADNETTKIFSNEELSLLIDPVLMTDDKNFDGFIDYPEFVSAQNRGF